MSLHYNPAEDKELPSSHVEDRDPLNEVQVGKGDSAHLTGAQVKAVRNAELYAAIQESNIPRWSPASVHLYFSMFIAFCCAVANGYDGSLMTAIIAMEPFQRQFNSGTTGVTVSVIFSLYTTGAIVGSLCAAVVSDKYGRRKTIFVGGVLLLTGMIIATTAKKIPQLVVGRFILGSGTAFMVLGAPAYTTEIAPPQWRGRCTGLYNTGWFAGSIPAAAVTFGCNYIDSNLAWQIPVILQAFACVIAMVGVFFIPESPRFLMANGCEEEAIELLVKYHGNGDPHSKLVALEVEEMRAGIRQDGADKRWWDYRPLLMTRNGRWRMAQVVMMSIFGQFSGNGLGYFNTVIFANLGISSSAQQLGYNLLTAVVSAVGAVTGASLTDRMPRRKVLIFGTLACACALATNAGLSAALAEQGDNVVKSYAQGALASYFLFNVFVMFTYTPLQAVVPSEALETTTRAKGLALSGVIANGMGFINQFCGPIALGNIGYKYIYIFVAWDCIEALCWYLFGVEAQGRTIEELDWVYNQPNPVKASLKIDKVVVQADGTVSEKVAEA